MMRPTQAPDLTRELLQERLRLVKVTVQDVLLLLNTARVYREHGFPSAAMRACDLESDARAHLQQVLGAIEYPRV